MKYEIEITESARRDFENIYLYISGKLCNKQAAKNLIALLNEKIGSLAEMPEGYPQARDEYLKDMGIRFIPVKNYIVFYTADTEAKKVYIVRVLYGKRSWENILYDDLKKLKKVTVMQLHYSHFFIKAKLRSKAFSYFR